MSISDDYIVSIIKGLDADDESYEEDVVFEVSAQEISEVPDFVSYTIDQRTPENPFEMSDLFVEDEEESVEPLEIDFSNMKGVESIEEISRNVGIDLNEESLKKYSQMKGPDTQLKESIELDKKDNHYEEKEDLEHGGDWIKI